MNSESRTMNSESRTMNIERMVNFLIDKRYRGRIQYELPTSNTLQKPLRKSSREKITIQEKTFNNNSINTGYSPIDGSKITRPSSEDTLRLDNDSSHVKSKRVRRLKLITLKKNKISVESPSTNEISRKQIVKVKKRITPTRIGDVTNVTTLTSSSKNKTIPEMSVQELNNYLDQRNKELSLYTLTDDVPMIPKSERRNVHEVFRNSTLLAFLESSDKELKYILKRDIENPGDLNDEDKINLKNIIDNNLNKIYQQSNVEQLYEKYKLAQSDLERDNYDLLLKFKSKHCNEV